ncbi:MAG: response regulator [Zetaproteobacteria bacterium]|nr:response regulator [Zetaproteobacteria bacterium]
MILVVDDSKAMRMIVKRSLRAAGIEPDKIDEAEDGSEGFQKATSQDYDCIFCDWNMPRMSGIEFLKALRESGKSTRFVMVTSIATPDIKETGISAGAAAVIGKPFSPDDIKTALGL